MADLSVHELLLYFYLYLYLYTQFLPHLLIQNSHYSGKLPLQLGPFHPPIYPLGTPELAIAATIFSGELQATSNESISVALSYVWSGLVLVSTMYGLQVTLNESISSAPASVSMYYWKTGWRSLQPRGGIKISQGRAWQSNPSSSFPYHRTNLLLRLPPRSSFPTSADLPYIYHHPLSESEFSLFLFALAVSIELRRSIRRWGVSSSHLDNTMGVLCRKRQTKTLP